MPELPEVQTIVAALRPRLVGLRIAVAELTRTDILTPSNTPLPALLQHRVITDVSRRGKYILFTLDDSNRFSIHLGMTGRLTLSAPSTPPPSHTHLRLHLSPPPHPISPALSPPLSHEFSHALSHPFSHAEELRFSDPRRFGGIRWLGQSNEIETNLGPEPLTLRPAQFSRLLKKTTRPIKSALLDQKLIAGLGNIYADEALHAAALHPLTPAGNLSSAQSAQLCRSIKRVLRRALRHKGSTLRDYRTADGQQGAFQKLHRVYARAGKPCLTCTTPIERIVLAGRSTHFCPKCQPPCNRMQSNATSQRHLRNIG